MKCLPQVTHREARPHARSLDSSARRRLQCRSCPRDFSEVPRGGWPRRTTMTSQSQCPVWPQGCAPLGQGFILALNVIIPRKRHAGLGVLSVITLLYSVCVCVCVHAHACVLGFGGRRGYKS